MMAAAISAVGAWPGKRSITNLFRNLTLRLRLLRLLPFQEAQDVPKSALGGFETTRQAFQFLKVGVSSRAPALFLEAAQRVSSSLLELLRHLRIGPASPKVGFRRYFQRSCASPLSSSPRVHEPTGPRDHGSTGPRVHEPTGPRDHGCTGPRVHGTTGPRAHGSTGP